MKRSEMLAVIDKVYGEFCGDWLWADLNNLEGFIPLNERILSALEEAGMLPPEIKGKSWIIAEDGEMIYAVNEWEEE